MKIGSGRNKIGYVIFKPYRPASANPDFPKNVIFTNQKNNFD